jgi:hypothetical protein
MSYPCLLASDYCKCCYGVSLTCEVCLSSVWDKRYPKVYGKPYAKLYPLGLNQEEQRKRQPRRILRIAI